MLWGPEDWDAWEMARGAKQTGPFHLEPALLDTLRRIPGRAGMSVADLGCGRGRLLPFLAAHFRRVVAVDYAPATLAIAREEHPDAGIEFRRRDLRDLRPFRGAFDVAVAVDSVVGPRQDDVDRILEQVYRSLKEGGLLVATFPAAERRGRPVPMSLRGEPRRPDPLQVHETELQYLLRRTGYRGVRIRRFDRPGSRRASLLCVAARRADN